jgi:hypothetical protein
MLQDAPTTAGSSLTGGVKGSAAGPDWKRVVWVVEEMNGEKWESFLDRRGIGGEMSGYGWGDAGPG